METYLRAHFDGHSIVLDEPAALTPGQTLRVLVEPVADAPINPAHALQKPLFGAGPGMFGVNFTPDPDATAAFMSGEAWDEGAALHVDPLDRVPEGFVREPGSAEGEIRFHPGFDDIPEGFAEYL